MFRCKNDGIQIVHMQEALEVVMWEEVAAVKTAG